MTEGLSRRNLMIGGGIGLGLIVAWQAWPREYRANMPVGKGEHGFGSWLKIAENGTITIAVPQSEMGQGVYTAFAQMVAGELGADWRTVAVQPCSRQPRICQPDICPRMACGDVADKHRGIRRR